ncbi:hypothetical protein M0813_15139 [Anaeramoeba flamelloides]|uniref:Uncharacterized protein n=1 Tax=Anaeramoeba flamelloides TaxID=1746091 RepID=A0ABQ8Z3C2_9EUKA|nr:hypothetical protein M0813_15139 [Anaeramoeba flamelloides]
MDDSPSSCSTSAAPPASTVLTIRRTRPSSPTASFDERDGRVWPASSGPSRWRASGPRPIDPDLGRGLDRELVAVPGKSRTRTSRTGSSGPTTTRRAEPRLTAAMTHSRTCSSALRHRHDIDLPPATALHYHPRDGPPPRAGRTGLRSSVSSVPGSARKTEPSPARACRGAWRTPRVGRCESRLGALVEMRASGGGNGSVSSRPAPRRSTTTLRAGSPDAGRQVGGRRASRARRWGLALPRSWAPGSGAGSSPRRTKSSWAFADLEVDVTGGPTGRPDLALAGHPDAGPGLHPRPGRRPTACAGCCTRPRRSTPGTGPG